MIDNDLPINNPYFFVPATLDTLKLLPAKLKKHVDKYNYVLHIIYVARKVDKRNTSSRYIRLNAKVLEAVLSSRKYLTYVQFWIDQGVIERKSGYIPGQMSKGYRFTFVYQKARVKRVAIQDSKFRDKLSKRKQMYLERVDLTDAKLSFLHTNLKQVRVDAIPALFHAHKLFKTKGSETDSFNEYCIAICEFAQGNYFFTRDVIGKRVHNNFVNFPKVLRQFLYLETGEQLVNLDVRNSQPLMLCVLLNEHYQGKTLPLDVQAYILQCQEGRFYEAFSEAAGIHIGDRKRFKQKLFTDIFFGKNENSIKSLAYQALKATYPNVATFIKEFKRQDYKSLAVALQKVESRIIIDGVIGGLAVDYNPDEFFALTIHDSVTTTLSNKDEIMMRMEMAFAKEGIKVTINSEFFEQSEKLMQVA